MSEREVKLLVSESFVLPVLDDAVRGATLGEPEHLLIDDAYHDTADLRLARWGCTLRHRGGEGWTLKLPRRSTGSMLDREEVTWRGEPDAPPVRARTAVASLTLGAELGEVARLRTERSVRRWWTDAGDPLAELCDDHVSGTGPTGDAVRFREIEVELAPDAPLATIDGVLERLEAGTVPGRPVPKLVRVLGAAATGPPDVAPDPLPERPTAREVIRRALMSSVAQLLLQLPVARLDTDPEGVHQARVAIRRIRSDLTTFGRLLDDDWRAELDDELEWLIDELGAVRDGDVLGARLRDLLASRPEIDDDGGRSVLDEIERRRRAARTRLLRDLRGKRSTALLDHLVQAAADPRTTPRADRPASEEMPKLVRRRWRRLVRAVEAAGADPAPEDLHAVRIQAKKVRYASESVAPAVGRRAKRFARRAARIQDELGDLHDRAVARDVLAELASELDGRAAFAAGQLAQQLLCEVEASDVWRRSFDAMSRRTDWFS
ncbi:MAG: CYTH and CHAD domain-containing protein [Actinomycetota bacterium]